MWKVFPNQVAVEDTSLQLPPAFLMTVIHILEWRGAGDQVSPVSSGRWLMRKQRREVRRQRLVRRVKGRWRGDENARRQEVTPNIWQSETARQRVEAPRRHGGERKMQIGEDEEERGKRVGKSLWKMRNWGRYYGNGG